MVDEIFIYRYRYFMKELYKMYYYFWDPQWYDESINFKWSLACLFGPNLKCFLEIAFLDFKESTKAMSVSKLAKKTKSTHPTLHRLIIPRLTKLFVFLENWTFCCPVLGSRHCTCAYTETVDPACRPSIPHKWYWHGLYGRGQLGSIWYGRGIAPSPFTL